MRREGVHVCGGGECVYMYATCTCSKGTGYYYSIRGMVSINCTIYCNYGNFVVLINEGFQYNY